MNHKEIMKTNERNRPKEIQYERKEKEHLRRKE